MCGSRIVAVKKGMVVRKLLMGRLRSKSSLQPSLKRDMIVIIAW